METPYRTVDFSFDEVLTLDKLQQIQANNQWIKDNTPASKFYSATGGIKSVRNIYVCGRADFGKVNQINSYKNVSFGRSFAPNCNPNVTTSIVTEEKAGLFVVTSGIGSKALPQHNGCRIQLTIADMDEVKKSTKPVHVYWQAFGFRQDDMNEF